ncbi:nitroreductase family protein, partial [Pseudomonas aeruginosa]|uniref:nitroreductase family protein n=1 Tax=Pseudomonas aeruginosa TaxID=287 RepID=UPI0021564FA5
MEALDALLTRVSHARLSDPAPSPEQLDRLFRVALRAPDHGQLRPWRFILVEGKGRRALGDLYALSLIHISEPTRHLRISYAVFCLKQKSMQAT